jgi:nitroreductase
MINETLTTIRARRSIRSYIPQQIKDEELNTIIEAGLYAPSAMNQQSWHFTVVQNKDIIAQMAQDIKEQLGRDEKFNPFYNAPTLIIISGDEKAIAPHADCAAAAQNIMIAAQSLNIGSCWVNMIKRLFMGRNENQWRQDLVIPEGFIPLYSVILGYRADDNAKTPPRKENAVNYIR